MFWDAETGTFYNPGHGERFSMTGAVLSGPAQRRLWECPLEERGDQLWIRAPAGADATAIIAVCKASS
jgi:Rieske Fe-S protein